MKKKIAYKILRSHNKRLYSSNKKFSDVVSQRYFTNRINYPKIVNSYLFAFSHKEFAFDQVECELRYYKPLDYIPCVYKCEIEIPDTFGYYLCKIINSRLTVFCSSLEYSTVQSFWNKMQTCDDITPNEFRREFDSIYLSAGTILCSSIKLLEKLKI